MPLDGEAHSTSRTVRGLLVHALVAAGPAPDALEALGLADEFSFRLESSFLLGLRHDLQLVESMKGMCRINEFRVVREVVLGPQFLRPKHLRREVAHERLRVLEHAFECLLPGLLAAGAFRSGIPRFHETSPKVHSRP